MNVKTSYIVKYYRNFLVNWRFVTTTMSCSSKFSSYVTMISKFFIVNEFFTNLASITWLKLFFFFTHDQIFVKGFFHYLDKNYNIFQTTRLNHTMIFFNHTMVFSLLLTVFILPKNCFINLISKIFTSKNNYWLGKFIINTNKFVNKLLGIRSWYFSWVRTFITFNINFKWNLY